MDKIIDDDARMRYNTIAKIDTIMESSTVELRQATARTHHQATANVRQQVADKSSREGNEIIIDGTAESNNISAQNG